MKPAIYQRWNTMIVDGATRPATVGIGSPKSWSQSDWQVSPMDQIGTDGVTPVNLCVERTVRIVLVEEVILPLPLDQPVRIIHPVRWWQEMVVRPMRIIG